MDDVVKKVANESLNNKYGNYAMVFCLKGVKNLQDYQEKLSAIFESVRIVKNVEVCIINDCIFILFDKIKPSQHSCQRFANSIANCLKGIEGNAVIRIQLLKDAHINDVVLKNGICVFDQFISNGSLFQKDILANLLFCL